MMRRGLWGLVLAGALALAGCVSLLGQYDPEFERSLAEVSDDTARFLAEVSAGKPARLASSSEAIAYYAGSYNVLDRLAQRGALERGGIPCGEGEALQALAAMPPQLTVLPADVDRIDCRETQVYLVRFSLDQLYQAQQSGGSLNPSEATAFGRKLQAQIFIAMQVAQEGGA